MMVTSKRLAWLVGILEGEAWFGYMSSVQNGKRYIYASIDITMTDRDVIEKVAAMFGKSLFIRPRQKPHHHDSARVIISGKRGLGWMLTLWADLSMRRRSQIQRVLRLCHKQLWTGYMMP